jgi:hypothetical protein
MALREYCAATTDDFLEGLALTTSAAAADVPRFDELVRLHHREPERVAQGLRAMARRGLGDAEPARFAWLVNHVVGETQGGWAEAVGLLEQAVGDSRDPGVLRHRAVAESFSGAPLAALARIPDIAAGAGTTPQVASLVVRLGILQFAAEDTPVVPLAAAFDAVLSELRGAPEDTGRLGATLAASLNNVTSWLLDAKAAPVDDPVYRRALADGAALSKTFWTRAGTWMNRERADYLIALCANRLDDHGAAEEAALTGLRTIDENGSEDVDRAFLLIELARARRGLDRVGESEEARAAAFALAGAFDADLRAWFDSRAAA